MLINDTEQFVRVPFTNEAEIEGVVQRYAEQLFGSGIIYLPQMRISTLGGRRTVPDAVVIDVESEEWYIVEAERSVHGTWEHIAPQVSRQLAAVSSTETRELILQLALAAVAEQASLRGMFRDIGIGDLEIHGTLHRVLRKRPTIAIPIDHIPKDLTDWAQTLRNTVKIWVIEKYVAVSNSAHVLYSLPEENLPTLSTAPAHSDGGGSLRASGTQPYQELMDAFPSLEGKLVTLEYGPRGMERKSFRGILRKEGIQLNESIFSPSYAAVQCMREAGSTRHTANGWTMWKTEDGRFLNDWFEEIGSAEANKGETENLPLEEV
ncbi:hypothetical protein BH23GEM6_BH23GEM6_15410 [soil metagenome]